MHIFIDVCNKGMISTQHESYINAMQVQKNSYTQAKANERFFTINANVLRRHDNEAHINMEQDQAIHFMTPINHFYLFK